MGAPNLLGTEGSSFWNDCWSPASTTNTSLSWCGGLPNPTSRPLNSATQVEAGGSWEHELFGSGCVDHTQCDVTVLLHHPVGRWLGPGPDQAGALSYSTGDSYSVLLLQEQASSTPGAGVRGLPPGTPEPRGEQIWEGSAGWTAILTGESGDRQ